MTVNENHGDFFTLDTSLRPESACCGHSQIPTPFECTKMCLASGHSRSEPSLAWKMTRHSKLSCLAEAQ